MDIMDIMDMNMDIMDMDIDMMDMDVDIMDMDRSMRIINMNIANLNIADIMNLNWQEYVAKYRECNTYKEAMEKANREIEHELKTHNVITMAFLTDCEFKLTDLALNAIKLFIDEIDLDARRMRNQYTALMWACCNNMTRVVRALLKTGKSNPGAINIYGETALIIMCCYERTNLALALIETGESNSEAVDKWGCTALSHARANNMWHVILALYSDFAYKRRRYATIALFL